MMSLFHSFSRRHTDTHTHTVQGVVSLSAVSDEKNEVGIPYLSRRLVEVIVHFFEKTQDTDKIKYADKNNF